MTASTTSKASKVENYSAEVTANLLADYAAGMTVEKLAENYGKGIRSIVAKLSRSGVYKKPEYKTKTGEAVAKKDDVADAIGKVLNLSENDTSSLAKANKTALKAIFQALAMSVPLDSVKAEEMAK